MFPLHPPADLPPPCIGVRRLRLARSAADLLNPSVQPLDQRHPWSHRHQIVDKLLDHPANGQNLGDIGGIGHVAPLHVNIADLLKSFQIPQLGFQLWLRPGIAFHRAQQIPPWYDYLPNRLGLGYQ